MSELPIVTGYKIEKELGKGGMADVYLGIQENLERKVAIKILIPELFRDGNFATRFLKEARTAGQLIHPGIVTIHDVGQFEKNYYIVMEYLPETLKDRIKKEPMAPDEALEIVGKVASALDYAHSKGFIHRDIKPDNIMFREDGTPVLVDFGIARAVGSTTKLTKTGMSIGTPHYMSPEQSRGKPLDGRSDIYSLGVVLFEMLTGKTPFEAEDSDSIAIAIKHIQEDIPELSASLQPSAISKYKTGELEKLQILINKMMAKEAADRPQTGRELIDLINNQLPAGNSKHEIRNPKQIQNPNDQNEDEQPSAFNQEPSVKDKNLSEDNVGANGDSPKSSVVFGLPEANGLNEANVREVENHPKEISEIDIKKTLIFLLLGFLLIITIVFTIGVIVNKIVLNSSSNNFESSYISQVTLRSSYETLSEAEVRSMLVSKNFYSKKYSSNKSFCNPSGNFLNDFQSKTISGDKVVLDLVTSLMWHQSGSTKDMKYSKAEEWVSALNRRGYAGYSDWRLPTLEEAASLLESSQLNGELYINSYFSMYQIGIWTGDIITSGNGWIVRFMHPSVFNFEGNRHIFSFVRPVRSMK